VLLGVLLGLVLSLPARADLTCPAGPIVFSEQTFYGFYVAQLDGTALDSVTLRYFPVGPPTDPFVVTLTARLGAYDGAVIGSPVTRSFFTPIPPGPISVTFDFGGAPVPPGSRVTFTQAVVATPLGGTLSFDPGPCAVGDASCASCPLFTETEDTTPPLSTFRRRSVAATIVTSGTATPAAVPALGFAGSAALLIGLAAAGWWIARARPS
jgi:hypothetical protein